MPTPDTIGYRSDKLPYHLKWVIPNSRTYDSVTNPLGMEESVSLTEVQIGRTSHQVLGLQFPPRRHEESYRGHYLTQKEELEHKTRVADEMIQTYLRGEGKDLNIKPKQTYFDMGAIEKDSFTDNFIIRNEPEYFSSFKETQCPNPWNIEEPKHPEKESFISGMVYDPNRERINIDIETRHYTYSDYHFITNPAVESAHLNAIVDLRRDQIKNNLTIIVKSRANPICGALKNELVAIETLREMITELEFRKYMIHGFILVRGLSGRVYQIFRDKDHTKVWEKGRVVEEVCVRIKRSTNVPPTDNVIAFRALVLYSEDEFKKLGNVYRMAA